MRATGHARNPGGAPTGSPLLGGIAANIFTIAVGALNVLFTLLVARLLGKVALGAFLLAWATAGLLSKLGTLGFDQGTTALVARRRAEGDRAGARSIYRLALAAGVGVSAVVAGVAWVVFGWFENTLTPELLCAQRAMLLSLPAIALYRIANGASRGAGIMKHDALSGGFAQNLAKIAALSAFVWLEVPAVIGAAETAVLAAGLGFAAAGAAAFLLARGALARGDAGHERPASPPASTTGLVPLSVAAAGAGLANLAMQRMDVLVLGAFVGRAPGLDAAAFGVYCAAAEIAGVIRKVRFAAEAPLLHAVASAHGRGSLDEERSALGDVARWTLPALLLVAAGVALGSPLWLSLFGPGFERGAALLALLVVAHAIGGHSGLGESVLLLRRPALNLVNSGLAVTAYVGLALVLVPAGGAAAAAVAAVAAYGIVAALRFAQLRRMAVPWPWRRLRGIASPFVVALAPAVAVRAVLPGPPGAALAVLVFAVVFVAALLRALDHRDREALRAVAPSLRLGRAGACARPGGEPPRPVLVGPGPEGPTVILVVSSEDDGGAARSTFLLARDLPRFGVRPLVALHREGKLSRRLADAGIAFEVVPGLPEDLTRRPGRPASVWAVPANLRALRRCVSFLRGLAGREGAALLYGQGTWANLLAAFAARGSAAAAVWHIRNDFRPRLKRLLMRSVARACDVRAILAVSRSAAAPLEALPTPLHVIENGADLAACDAARESPDELRRRLGIPPGAVVACYAGRLLPHKGIHVLMEAARRALSRSPSLHVVILGESPAHAAGDVRGELARQAASWGLGGRIHLAGWVPRVERALVGFDLVVIPSTCRECCSRSLIESLCLGLPVVATDIGGNPELLRDGENGLLVRPGDPDGLAEALVALADDAALRRRLAVGALAARHRFDSVTVARRVAAVLRTSAAGEAGKAKAWEPVPAEP